MLTALDAGVRQIVICGAGYDDRALRFRTPGARFFEVDQGPTQADKARRLRAMDTDLTGLTLATADFRGDDVAAVLAGCGHDPGQPTLFLCEGLPSTSTSPRSRGSWAASPPRLRRAARWP